MRPHAEAEDRTQGDGGHNYHCEERAQRVARKRGAAAAAAAAAAATADSPTADAGKDAADAAAHAVAVSE